MAAFGSRPVGKRLFAHSTDMLVSLTDARNLLVFHRNVCIELAGDQVRHAADRQGFVLIGRDTVEIWAVFFGKQRIMNSVDN